nr:MAG TPA: hypothetical protein [Caudoviricetes sp.]
MIKPPLLDKIVWVRFPPGPLFNESVKTSK